MFISTAFLFTSDRAKEKVIDLAKIVLGLLGGGYSVCRAGTEIQTKIVEACPGTSDNHILSAGDADRPGDCQTQWGHVSDHRRKPGQVASQTQEGLGATNAVVDLPVFRPLIGMDKQKL